MATGYRDILAWTLHWYNGNSAEIIVESTVDRVRRRPSQVDTTLHRTPGQSAVPVRRRIGEVASVVRRKPS